jgi:lipopolysaccharide export system protein LptC
LYSIQGQNYQAAADARYAKARRHSRRVRQLRVAVPVMVAAAMLTIIGISLFNPFRILSKLPIDIGKLGVSGTKITMDSPHLAGFTPDQRPYELWAKSAVQDVTRPNNVELHELRAKVQMEDRTGITMDARTGLFDTKTQLLDLKDSIFLQSTTGYEARLTQATVDMAGGTVSSDEPVAVKLLNGTLDANRLRILENGAVVRFEGGVSMILIPEQPSDGTAPVQTPARDAAAK